MPSYTASATVVVNLAKASSSASWVPGAPNSGTSSWSGVGTFSDYLVFKGFGFAVPSDETIVGYLVDYQIQGQPDTNQTACDKSVQIVVSPGVVSTADRATGTTYSNVSLDHELRGDALDDWGINLSSATVNAAGFGFQVSGQINGGAVGPLDLLAVSAASMTIYTSTGSTPPSLNHPQGTVYIPGHSVRTP